MTEEQAKALREPFPAVQKVRKEWTDKKTGERKSITLDYISHAVVTDRLLSVDPEFSFHPVYDGDGRPLVVTEGLAPGDSVGVWGILFILGTGVTEFCSGKDLMDAYSRCLCRCAMRRGVALDLWMKDDAPKETRKEGGLGDFPVPKSWAKVRAWYEDVGGGDKAWQLAEAFTRAASYHLFGATDSKQLTPDQRKVMLQKAAGATVWLAEHDNTPMGPAPSVAHYQQAWAHVLDGTILEVPDAPDLTPEQDADEIERLAKLADEVITGPPE